MIGNSLQTLFYAVIFVCIADAVQNAGIHLNFRPIIGILTQRVPNGQSKYGDTYIPSSYVKYLEEAGARVVPIRADQSPEYYEKAFSQINGVLFPGGGVGLIKSYYAQSGRFIYDQAIKANDAGDYFPLWGTCQGFQLLNNLTADENLITETDSENLPLPLNIMEESRNSSRLFGRLPNYIHSILTTRNVTFNNHHYSMTTKTFHNTPALTSFYRVLSTNVDRKGIEFVSTFEAMKYPFYGTQWHPEKNNFNWDRRLIIDHSDLAVDVAQFFANFLVNEARKNLHRFANPKDEIQAMIENYRRVYLPDGSFNSIYFFKINGTDPFMS